MPRQRAAQEELAGFLCRVQRTRFRIVGHHGVLRAEYVTAFPFAQQVDEPVFPEFRWDGPLQLGMYAAHRGQGGHGEKVAVQGQFEPAVIGFAELPASVEVQYPMKIRREKAVVSV